MGLKTMTKTTPKQEKHKTSFQNSRSFLLFMTVGSPCLGTKLSVALGFAEVEIKTNDSY